MARWIAVPLLLVSLVPSADAQVPEGGWAYGFVDPELVLDQNGRGVAPFWVRNEWPDTVCAAPATFSIPFWIPDHFPAWAGASLQPYYVNYAIPEGYTPAQTWNTTLAFEVAWDVDRAGENDSYAYTVKHQLIKEEGGPCQRAALVLFVDAIGETITVRLPDNATSAPRVEELDPIERYQREQATAAADPPETQAAVAPSTSDAGEAPGLGVLVLVGLLTSVAAARRRGS